MDNTAGSGNIDPQFQKRLLFEPNISINGPVDNETVKFWLERIANVRSSNEDLILELNTIGGDADAARRIAQEVRLFLRHSGRQGFCIGKSYVYSAGVTILAAFPKANRYLADDAILLIHERRLQDKVELTGPIKACLQIAREKVSMLETAARLEKEGFAELTAGSGLSLDTLYDCLLENCYLSAEDALRHGLVEGVLR